MIEGDARRKLSDTDYQQIKLRYALSHTIREISNEFGVSTKYVKRIVENQLTPSTNTTEEVWVIGSICSGCNRSFDKSGMDQHFSIWTSGPGLACADFMPHA